MISTPTGITSMLSDGIRHLSKERGLRAPKIRRLRWLMYFLLGVLLTPLQVACHGKDESTPVGIVGYNHTSRKIAQFLINGSNGDTSIDAHSGGGSASCCAMVPDHWRPGLKVTISWTEDLKSYQKQVIPIPEYDEKAGHMAVHFLRNGRVVVFVTDLYLGHPDYPLTGSEAGLRDGEDPVREDLKVAKEGEKK